MVRWPDVLAHGTVFTQRIAAHDWLQSLTSSTGVKLRNVKPARGVEISPARKAGAGPDLVDLARGIYGNCEIFGHDW